MLSKHAGLWIFALALALRVAHVLFMRSSPAFERPSMDALYHWQWAQAFAEGTDFQLGPFFRAPLYIWFLGLCHTLFGASFLIPRLLQAVLGACAAYFAYRLGRRTFDFRVGVITGLLVACSWVLIYFDGELLIPTLILPLNLAALWLTVGLARSDEGGARTRRAFAAGLCWGLSAIARPNVLLVQPVLALWLIRERGIKPVLRNERGARPAHWVVYTLGVLAPILPITAYNVIEGGDRVLISSQAGVNFWIGNNPESDGSSAIVPGTRGGWWEGYHDAIAQAESALRPGLLPSEVSGWYADRTWDWISQNPGDAVVHVLWKLRLFFTDWELGNNQEVRFFAHHFSPVARMSPVGFPLLVGLASLGIVLCLSDRKRRGRCFPPLAFLCLYTLSVVAFFVCSRFRAPVLPVLALFSAVGLVWLFDKAAQRAWPRLGLGAALALIAGFATTLRPAAIKTTDANGYLQLGHLAEQMGQARDAEGHYRYASQLDPGNPFAQVSLARVQLADGRPVEAEGALQAILAIDPWRADAVDIWLRVLLERGRDQELEAKAIAWSERSSHLASPWFHRARLRLRQEQWAEAIIFLQRAIERDPRHLEGLLELAAVQMRLSIPEPAIASYERALPLASLTDGSLAREIAQTLIGLYEAQPGSAASARLSILRALVGN